MTQAKICGLSSPEAVRAAIEGGAAYAGFVFFGKSPRNVSAQTAAELAAPARAAGLKIVAVTVDASDAELDEIMRTLRPDFIQLHGRESPERAEEVKRRTGAGVIRAISVSEPADLSAAEGFASTDHLMFDSRPPAGHALPGGAGASFDWDLLAGRSFERPWFLAGGLDPENVADAVRRSGAPLVDVSSGVERAPGVKDPRLISAFLEAVRRA